VHLFCVSVCLCESVYDFSFINIMICDFLLLKNKLSFSKAKVATPSVMTQLTFFLSKTSYFNFDHKYLYIKQVS
jgi:hypothetical protein